MKQSLIVVVVHIDSDVIERGGDCYCRMKTNEETVTGLNEECPSPNQQIRNMQNVMTKTKLD